MANSSAALLSKACTYVHP